MRPGNLFRSSYRSLSRSTGRTLLMVLGTMAGVAALVVVVAIGDGAKQEMMDRMDVIFSGRSILLFSAGGGLSGPRGEGRTQPLTLADRREIQANLAQITHADPSLLVGSREVAFEGRSEELMIFGHSEVAEVVWSRGVVRGRFFDATDISESARVALVGAATALDLFGTDDPVGARFRIGAVPFEVIGVLESVGIDPHGLDRDDEIHVPVSTAMRRLANVDYIGSIKMLVADEADLDATVFAIEDLMRERHGLQRGEPNDFRMVTPAQIEETVGHSNRVFTVLLPLIAAVVMLGGVLVLANLMLMSVNERRAEIGLRKALGARDRDVRSQFVLEALLVTGTAGVLATAVGWGLVRLLSGVFTMPAELRLETALGGLGVALLTGVVVALVPARRAAALRPVETLR